MCTLHERAGGLLRTLKTEHHWLKLADSDNARRSTEGYSGFQENTQQQCLTQLLKIPFREIVAIQIKMKQRAFQMKLIGNGGMGAGLCVPY